MFTKEFIKISQILDQHGMHRQADDLLKIAQAKPAPKPPVKPAVKTPVKPATKPPVKPSTTPAPVTNVLPTSQNAIIKYFQDQLKRTNPPKFEDMISAVEKQYRNNLIDYKSYTDLIEEFNTYFNQNAIPIKPNDPTAFPSMVNDAAIPGSGVGLNDGKQINIELASPLEGLTAAGEKALPNREDRNLPGLVKEWNSYLKTDSFKDSLEARIQEMKKYNQDTTKLEELLSKTKTDKGLQVGDFGNVDSEGKQQASQIYGVEAKPLTSITGTPKTPAAPAAPTQAPNR
jgi:hypothetical protein